MPIKWGFMAASALAREATSPCRTCQRLQRSSTSFNKQGPRDHLPIVPCLASQVSSKLLFLLAEEEHCVGSGPLQSDPAANAIVVKPRCIHLLPLGIEFPWSKRSAANLRAGIADGRGRMPNDKHLFRKS